MSKKYFCGIFVLLLVSTSVFAEPYVVAAMDYLTHRESNQEFYEAAETWRMVLSRRAMNVSSVDKLPNEVYNEISKGLSRWRLRVGDVFTLSCSINRSPVSYEVILRITDVRNDGSCTYSWYAWQTI
jgi:hypothetical protein